MKNENLELLRKAARVKDPAERAIRIAATLAQALRQVGQDPILVGGAAVEFYTQGGYSTNDIDMVAPGGPPLVRVMGQLGFKKIGKDFFQPDLKIYVEFPGRALGKGERFQEIKMGDQKLKILSIEDLIVDRLAAFKFWQSAIDGTNAMLLLELDHVDEERLNARAKQAGVNDALLSVKEVKTEVIRKNLKPEAGNQLLIKRMKALLD